MSRLRYEKWTDIDWNFVQSEVYSLQKRIYKASQKSELKQAHSLQRLLITSFLAKLLAVKQIDQLNQTFVANNPVHKLEMEDKWILANNLKLDKQFHHRKQNLRITAEQAKQMLVNMALEPQWQAKFDQNSTCFSCPTDVFSAISHQLKSSNLFGFTSKIQGNFEQINHNLLLDRIETFPSISKQLRRWLKSGLIQGDLFTTYSNHCRRNAILSPLLANIVLNQLDDFVRHQVKMEPKSETSQENYIYRYQNNLLMVNSNSDVLGRIRKQILQWLQNLGLQLELSKTKIVRVSQGFDFLQWNWKICPIGKNSSQKVGNHDRLMVQPSQKAIAKHYHEIKSIFRQSLHLKTSQLIHKLNRKMKNWAKYHQLVMSAKISRQLDNLIYRLQWQWVRKKHPHQGIKKLVANYFTSVKGTWRLYAEKNGHRQILYAYRN